MPQSIFIIFVLFFSVVIHEIAHGSVALSLGDPTAKEEGRLTLNPLKHIDPIGTIFLPFFLFLVSGGKGPIFGWAKPVPINPSNFRDRKWGIIKVSLAGSFTNFLIATIFALFVRFFHFSQQILDFFSLISIYNFAWGIFNLIPLPPLDGFHIFLQLLPEKFSQIKIFLTQYGFYILLFFLFFGLNLVFLFASFIFRLFSGYLY
jgi:Zn-dependent protease